MSDVPAEAKTARNREEYGTRLQTPDEMSAFKGIAEIDGEIPFVRGQVRTDIIEKYSEFQSGLCMRRIARKIRDPQQASTMFCFTLLSRPIDCDSQSLSAIICPS